MIFNCEILKGFIAFVFWLQRHSFQGLCPALSQSYLVINPWNWMRTILRINFDHSVLAATQLPYRDTRLPFSPRQTSAAWKLLASPNVCQIRRKGSWMVVRSVLFQVTVIVIITSKPFMLCENNKKNPKITNKSRFSSFCREAQWN